MKDDFKEVKRIITNIRCPSREEFNKKSFNNVKIEDMYHLLLIEYKTLLNNCDLIMMFMDKTDTLQDPDWSPLKYSLPRSNLNYFQSTSIAYSS